MIPFYLVFSLLIIVVCGLLRNAVRQPKFPVLMAGFQSSCTSEDQLLTEEGSGFEPPALVNISVELVSNRVFDPEKNASNLKIVKDTVDDYSKTEGIKYPSDNIKQSIVDHGGKFAVLFEIEDDARCDEVRRFIKGAKKHSKEVAYAVLKCDGEKTQVL